LDTYPIDKYRSLKGDLGALGGVFWLIAHSPHIRNIDGDKCKKAGQCHEGPSTDM